MVFGLLTSGIGLFIASFEDFRIREVPDIISYSLIVLGFMSGLITSIFYWDISFLIASIVGFVFAKIVGAILYYTGQWGGGDYKIMSGIGALIGIDILNWSGMPTLVLFIINSFFVAAILGVIWVIVLAIKKWKKFKKEFYEIRSDKGNKKIRILFLVIMPVYILIGVLLDFNILIKLFIFLALVMSYFSFYMSMFIRSVENVSMIKKLSVNKLVDGDWIVEEVKLKNKKKFKSEKTGLTSEDIKLLKDNKIKFVMVKEGLPFIPFFFVALIVTIIVGNWLVFLRI